MVEMRRHGAGSASPLSGKFVVSALPPGESAVQSSSPSIKVVIEGEEIHEIDGRPYVVRPGQMLLVDRGAPSRATVRRNQQTLGLCVYLPWRGDDGFDPNLLLPRAILQATDSNPLGRLIADYAARLHRAPGDAQLPAAMMAQVNASLDGVLSSAGQSIGALEVKKASTRQEIYHRLEIARALLHENIDRAVPLDELARTAGLSGFHLTRYFAAAYGAPPARYHRTLRLDRAAQRLRCTNLAITEVALDAGYAELSAFTHAFRREFGCPPTAIERPRTRLS
ncbi:AraC family transcriptional regulator [Sphingomonas sp.]|uniref:AraC family transcriptional regulator n=1 Tax=Sphingomonas sp. TaxID=28214 RepID=UPI0025D190D1|nr:AraC family transcriptional regulator [Sphingomonas sp.]